MAPKKAPSLASAFKGRWRIDAMDLWDRDAIDLIEPGFVAFNGEEGEMRFIAVHAWLDVRYETRNKVPVAEFSWEGVERRSTLGSRLGHLEKRRQPCRPHLLPQRRRLRLHMQPALTSSTACSHVRIQDVGRTVSFRGGGWMQAVECAGQETGPEDAG